MDEDEDEFSVKHICVGFMCHTYVFGDTPDGECPECGTVGTEIDDPEEFMMWWKSQF